jgi:hypothetical protein
MDDNRLTSRQATALRDRVMAMLRYSLLCPRRIEALGFDTYHPIYREIDTAYSAVQDLYIVCHREAVANHAGRGIERPPPITTTGPDRSPRK